MWTGEDVAIEVSGTGETPLGFQIEDETLGTPLDLGGFSIEMRIAKALGQDSILLIPANMGNTALGEFDIYVPGDILSADLDLYGEKVNLAYEIKIIDGDSVYTLMRGPLTLIPGI